MQFTKTLYTLFVCIGLIFVVSFLTTPSQEKTSFDQSASVVSGIFSLFKGNSAQIHVAPVVGVNPISTITPPPPGMFDGILCKDSGCDTGSSVPFKVQNGGIFDSNGTWPESLERLFKDARAKEKELMDWLSTKCNEPGCERIQTGPSVSIRLKPELPGSCSVENTREFLFSSVKTSTVSCAKAEAEALADIGSQMSGIPDPCSSCGYSWTLSDLKVSCEQTPPPVKYIAKASMKAKVSCSGSSGGDNYLGWIEWNACYCCKVTNPPPASPTTPPLPTPVSIPKAEMI